MVAIVAAAVVVAATAAAADATIRLAGKQLVNSEWQMVNS
jgi:hypothetical protein